MPRDAEVDFLTGLTAHTASLVLVDRHRGRIVQLGLDGSILEYTFGPGFDDGQLRYPVDLCIDQDKRLFLADRGNNRVQIFEIKN